MSQKDWMTIDVANWEKFNPRNDRKMHSWFRLQNDILTEPKFYGLSAAQKFCAVCLFAEVSKSGGKRARVRISLFCEQLKMERREVEETIAVLINEGVLVDPSLEISPQTPGGNHPVTTGNQSVSLGSTTDVRTYGRNETDKTNEPEFARARDTGQDKPRDQGSGPGMDYRPLERDRDPGDFDFEGPELIAQTIARELAAQSAKPEPPAPKAPPPPTPIRPVIAPRPAPATPQSNPDLAQPLFDPERYQHAPYVPPDPDLLRKLRELGLGDPYAPDPDPDPEPEWGMTEVRYAERGVAA